MIRGGPFRWRSPVQWPDLPSAALRWQLTAGHKSVLRFQRASTIPVRISWIGDRIRSCPEAHVEVLKKMIPHVRKILTVGWRATEDKFLNLLFSNLNTTAPPDLMIVSGDVGGATETLNNLTTAGQTHGLRFSRKAEPIIDGFTGLIRRLGQLEGFLRDTAAAAFRG